jgi:hypothetical protein
VLELEGQFASFDSYLLDAQAAHLAGTEGDWHLSCLRDSGLAPDWSAALLRNYINRGFSVVSESKHWTVLRGPRPGDTLAFERAGDLIRMPVRGTRLDRVPGGVVQWIVCEEFNLELQDAAIIADMQTALEETGSYPLTKLLEGLCIMDRMLRPALLASGRFRLTRDGQREWRRYWVTAAAEYGRFIPDELEEFLPGRPRT